MAKETQGQYYLVSVLNGEGKTITSEGESAIQKGSHFIIPSTLGKYQITGGAEMIVSYPTRR